MEIQLWPLAAAAAVLIGCGSVRNTPGDGGPGDAPGTCAGDTVAACGASCATCQVSGDRVVPTCNGMTCGSTCKGNAPACSDNTCSRTQWTFDNGAVDGITPRTPNGLQLAVRTFNGAMAMAIDRGGLTQEVSFRIPICLSGTVDVRPKTFKLQVFFQGGDPSGEQYYIQGALPSPQNGAFIGSRGIQAGLWVPFSAPLAMSQFSGTCSDISIQLGSFGAAFSGTIWVDDIQIE